MPSCLCCSHCLQCFSSGACPASPPKSHSWRFFLPHLKSCPSCSCPLLCNCVSFHLVPWTPQAYSHLRILHWLALLSVGMLTASSLHGCFLTVLQVSAEMSFPRPYVPSHFQGTEYPVPSPDLLFSAPLLLLQGSNEALWGTASSSKFLHTSWLPTLVPQIQ